jgi:monovalent cation:proton antiporter-2 (CPA2) family protein
MVSSSLIIAAVFLGAAVIAVPLSKRFGLGSVLGYLGAGIVIGPSVLGLVHDVHETMHFAELGVVFLLFLIGLELQPSRLWSMRNAVFGLGGAQVGLTTVVVGAVALAAGVPWQAALVVGIALAMSSTAMGTQILMEKSELRAPHGRSAFAILLFQDLVAIPVLALTPMLGPDTATESTADTWVQALQVVGVLVGLVVVGRFALRPALKFIAQAKIHELSVASALLVVIGTAILMDAVGLSMALGAFLAGVLLADSEYRHELEANLEPFKGLLLGLFFIAVGMSANLRVLSDQPLLVLGLAFGLVAAKFLILFGLGRLRGHPNREAVGLGVAISQGGEFGFVIFAVSLQANVIAAPVVELLVVVVTLSMITTPVAFILRDRALLWAAKGQARPYDTIDDEARKVLIAGFGRFGQIVGRVLRTKHIAFTALDGNAEHVDFIRRFGNRIHYGDASRVDLLRAAKASEAAVFVLAIDDFEASMRTLRTVQEHFPHLRIVARARNRQHAYALLGAGVTHVIRETLAGSLDAARLTLEALGTEPKEARSVVSRFAEYDEGQVREQYRHRDDEKKLVESARRYSAELERILEEDMRAAPSPKPAGEADSV